MQLVAYMLTMAPNQPISFSPHQIIVWQPPLPSFPQVAHIQKPSPPSPINLSVHLPHLLSSPRPFKSLCCNLHVDVGAVVQQHVQCFGEDVKVDRGVGIPPVVQPPRVKLGIHLKITQPHHKHIVTMMYSYYEVLTGSPYQQ